MIDNISGYMLNISDLVRNNTIKYPSTEEMITLYCGRYFQFFPTLIISLFVIHMMAGNIISRYFPQHYERYHEYGNDTLFFLSITYLILVVWSVIKWP